MVNTHKLFLNKNCDSHIYIFLLFNGDIIKGTESDCKQVGPAPYSDSLSTLWRATEITNRLWKTVLPLALLSVITTSQPSPIHNKPRGSVWLLLDSLLSNKHLSRLRIHSMTDSAHYCTDKFHSSTLRLSFNQSLFSVFFFFWACGGYRPIFSIQAWRMTSWGEQLPSPFSQELIGTVCSVWKGLPLLSLLSFSVPTGSTLKKQLTSFCFTI